MVMRLPNLFLPKSVVTCFDHDTRKVWHEDLNGTFRKASPMTWAWWEREYKNYGIPFIDKDLLVDEGL